MMNAALQKAIDNLHIHDVYMRDSVAHCFGEFDAKYDSGIESLAVQFKYNVKRSQVVEFDRQNRLLRVFVETGARWLDEKIQDEADAIKAIVEAEYVAEYQIMSNLETECIEEFCLKNVSYHVWPYWREFLTSQCTRMHLPRVVLPTVQLAHNRHASSSEIGESTSK